MPGKDALEFDGDQAHVKVRLPKPMTQVTVAMWITMVSILDADSVCVLASDGWADAAAKCNVQIHRDGAIRLDTQNGLGLVTGPVFPWQKWRSPRWHHLVVVADAAHQTTACYVDGEQAYTGDLSSEFVATFGPAAIGNWWSLNKRYERGFRGCMDELAIFARALKEQEVKEMYETGRK